MKKFWLAVFAILFAMQAQASVSDLIDEVKQNNLSEVQKLLANGENVNAANEQGNTALHYAVALDNPQMVELLLAKGANLNAENQTGWTPLSISEKKQLPNVTPLLQKAQERAASAENTITQEEIASYKNLVERAKQEILTARRERSAMEEKNKRLEQEIQRLKAETERLQRQTATSAKAAVSVPVTVDVQTASTPKTTQNTQKKPEINRTQASKTISQINAGNEEVVYCLAYFGQGENQNLLRAAGYYAASAGISQVRYNKIAVMATDFWSTANETALKKRSTECSKIITPSNAERQNRIIRSMNRAGGY